MTMRRAVGTAALAAAACFLAATAPASGDISYNAGIYTQAQADRGLKLFTRNCAACHGDMFNGSESGPALSDGPFLDRWKDRTLADLYKKMHDTMPPPPDQPGRLSPQEYADIIAALLMINEMPAGKTELAADPAALARIHMR